MSDMENKLQENVRNVKEWLPFIRCYARYQETILNEAMLPLNRAIDLDRNKKNIYAAISDTIKVFESIRAELVERGLIEETEEDKKREAVLEGLESHLKTINSEHAK